MNNEETAMEALKCELLYVCCIIASKGLDDREFLLTMLDDPKADKQMRAAVNKVLNVIETIRKEVEYEQRN